MRTISKSIQALILGGVVVFLQTSCSKEQSTEQTKAPISKSEMTFDHTHDNVVNFITQYGLYQDGDVTSHVDLSVSDAEWLLEAAFNYTNSFESDSEDEATEIEYIEMDDITIPVSPESGQVLEEDLYNAFYTILASGATYSDIAPISDIEILPGDPSHTLTFRLANIKRIYNTLDPGVAYTEDAFACRPVTNGPMGPRNTCGTSRPWNDPQYWGINMLNTNLGRTYDPRLKQGYHTDVITITNATDAFTASTYDGFLDPGNNCQLAVWGISPTINPASTANGEPDQCLTPSDLTDYENGIKSFVNYQTPAGLSRHNVKLTHIKAPNNFNSSFQQWSSHKLSYTWSVFKYLGQ